MDRISYIPLIFLALAGLILLGASGWNTPRATVGYSESGNNVSQLKAGTRYVLRVDESESDVQPDLGVLDTLFWRFTQPDGNYAYQYAFAPVHRFDTPGKYIVDTYQLNGSLLATDTIHVAQGEYIDFDLANSSITEGEEVVATNKSTYKNATSEWVLLTEKGNELLLDTSDTLRVSDLNTGTYTVALYLMENGDTLATKSQGVTVKEKYVAPKPRPKNPVVMAKPKPKPTPRPKPTPKPKPVVKESPSEGWYIAKNGVGKFETGPSVPEKNDAHFSGGTVVIKVTPKTDVQLSSFSFWGNHNTGNYAIVYECLTCEDADRKKLRPFVFRTGNNFYSSQTRYLDSKSIGFTSGHTYKITLTTQENTEMQFEKLNKTRYENPNLTLEFITDRSSVFGLNFLKRPE